MRCAAMIAATLVVFTGSAVLTHAARADAPQAEALPTSDQLHQMFKDGQYQPLLQKLARVLQLRGPAAQRYDPVDLNLLKADTHLQLKELSLATTAAEQAAKAIDDHTDPHQAATARATLLLLKRSRQFTYVPKGAPRGVAPPPPISIVDPAQRTACFAAMFDDQKYDIQGKVRAARAAKTLVPIIEAINAVSELRLFELAAYGKDEQSVAQLDGLAQQAKDLMVRAVRELQIRQDKINQQANALVPLTLGRIDSSGTLQDTPDQTFRKKGLTPQQMNELKGIAADCKRISEAAEQFADISKATADAFDQVRTAADKAARSATDTLDDDYGGAFVK